MKQYLLGLVVMLAVVFGVQQPLAAATKPATQELLQKNKKQANNKSCKGQKKGKKTKSCCCKNTRLCQVNVANTPVGKKGTLVQDTVTGFIFYSNGTSWIQLESDLPVPPELFVDKNFVNPDGVFQFKTIQAAIDSLADANVINTQINVAPGIYGENVTFQSILNSDSTKLELVGDPRAIVGVGIANNSFWNATTTPAVPVGGGVGSVAVLQAISGTNLLTLTNSGTGIQPDFTAAGGVIPGDIVVLRGDNGAFNSYFVQTVGPTFLTFATNIVNTVGATATTLGGAMTVMPTVIIAPASGPVITQTSLVTLHGLTIEPSAADFGIYANPQSVTRLKNLLIYGGSIGINNSLKSTSVAVTAKDSPAGTYVYCDSSFGFTLFNQSIAGIDIVDGTLNPEGILIGVPATNPIAITTSFGTIYTGQFGIRTIGNLQIVFASKLGIGNSNIDIMSIGGSGVSAQQGSVVDVVGAGGVATRLAVRGVPTQGIFLGRATLQTSGTGLLSLISSAATFTGIQLSGGAGDGSWATAAIGNVSIPAGSGSTMVLAQDGSTFGFRGFGAGTTQTFGANCNGFQIFNGSTLVYRGTNVNGNIAGGGGTGTLFDVQGNSTLIMPLIGSNRTFTGFNTIFNFDTNSFGDVSSAAATTANAGGFDVVAQGMSRVLLGTVSLSGPGTGIKTSSGGYVGQVGSGITVSNTASTAFTPAGAKVSTAVPITNNYNDGTIVYNP